MLSPNATCRNDSWRSVLYEELNPIINLVMTNKFALFARQMKSWKRFAWKTATSVNISLNSIAGEQQLQHC